MGMTVTLDRMIHTRATHHELGKEFGLGECAAAGGDLSPIDLLSMSLASCLMLVMAKGAKRKGIDLTGTWAEVVDEVKDYKIVSVSVTIHSPQNPSDADRAFLEKESHECPVYLAVKGNVKVNVAFEWGCDAAPSSKALTQSQATRSTPCAATTHKP